MKKAWLSWIPNTVIPSALIVEAFETKTIFFFRISLNYYYNSLNKKKTIKSKTTEKHLDL